MKAPRRIDRHGTDIVTLHGLFSDAECAALVAVAEGVGFGAAPVTTGRGFVMMPEVRNNTRVMFDDGVMAADLWGRIAPLVPGVPGGEPVVPVGLNERLRFYRYEVGEYFRWHRDGAFCRTAHERSYLTVLVYLNDDFDGGSTDFDVGDEELHIAPERGLVLLFTHRLRHQGAPVRRGRKYVLRSDVMFRPASVAL